jgi:hypothetical protein
VLELVAGEPEAEPGLEMLTGRRLAVSRRAVREKVRPGVPDRRGCDQDRRAEVEGAEEDYKSRAAAISTSKSGTSASS